MKKKVLNIKLDGGKPRVYLDGVLLDVDEVTITQDYAPPDYSQFCIGKVGESYASGGVIGKPWTVDAAMGEPAPPPTVELMDSGNPFSQALEAWQSGKAGWTKNAYHTVKEQ